jgi:beta-galactosidase
MKASGINTVSTYVFWIHHEEERGKWDWSDQRSLRGFLKLCQEVGLKAVVRMGPYCHGEVRNGGFPDWVQHSKAKLRTKDPIFLELVGSLFKEEAKQMEGLLWKDGGPVIGVQLDNECDKGDYLLALKELARSAGVDVPFYSITGWQGGLPNEGLIPLFGGYTDGFWGGSHEEYRREFMFSGGMASSYNRRIQVDPNSVAAPRPDQARQRQQHAGLRHVSRWR